MAIKLEVGKTYLQRDGTRIRCDFIPENPICPQGLEKEIAGPVMALCTWWNSRGEAFSVHKHLNGRVYQYHFEDHQWDIVSEYTPPKEIWLVYYDQGFSYDTFEYEKDALVAAKSSEYHCTRKFREVIE